MKTTLINNEITNFGKGEVLSSILSGSTRKAHETRAFDATEKSVSAVAGRTDAETGNTVRGKMVDSVPRVFTPAELRHRAILLRDELKMLTERRKRLTPATRRLAKAELAEIEAAWRTHHDCRTER